MYACARKNLARLRPWFFWATDEMRLADIERFIGQMVSQTDPPTDFAYALWDGDTLAGTIGLHKIDWVNRIARIGYWIDEAYQGRGVVTGAARELVRKAFSELALNRVEIRCAPDNAASRAVPVRLGFKEEGTHRQVLALHGGYQDLVMYAVLASDWNDPGRAPFSR